MTKRTARTLIAASVVDTGQPHDMATHAKTVEIGALRIAGTMIDSATAWT